MDDKYPITYKIESTLKFKNYLERHIENLNNSSDQYIVIFSKLKITETIVLRYA